jgi:type IV secretion system protein VirD4
MRSEGGVYVGGWYNDSTRRLQYLRHNGPEHVLAFAPTRSGKGVGLVIPTLLAWDESAVIYDIKGENWAKTAGFRASRGQLCFKFSPVEETTSSRFNPLAEVRLFTPRDVSDAQNIADMIIRSGEDSPMERHWEDSAASLTTGMILHACYTAAAEDRVASLADLAGHFTRPGVEFRETLNEMVSYPHDTEYRHGWRTPAGLKTSTHPVVSEKAQEMLDKESKELSGVLSTAKTALALYSDPLVARNTAASDFTINDLVNDDRPVSLYLVVPPSDKIRLRRLIRLMFTMVVNRLTERMAFDGSEQRKNKHRLLFLIDEFPSLNRMEIFADALSYMAGYGLKAYLITQDIRQIVDAYGQNESIVSNCHVRIAFAPNQVDTAELLSKMTGTATVQKASFNFSGSRFSPVMSHVNASVDHIERPLMTPDEIMRLRPPKKEGNGDSEVITEPGDMLIFVSGHFPILGMQMLYFADPELARRSSIPPPIASRCQISPPLALRIDKPEFVTDDGATTGLERGFIEELRRS